MNGKENGNSLQPQPDVTKRASPRTRVRIAFWPLWLVSVALLLLSTAGLAAWLAMREPQVVQREAPAPTAPTLAADVLERAAVVHASNQALAHEIASLRADNEALPQCPPGTAVPATTPTEPATTPGPQQRTSP